MSLRGQLHRLRYWLGGTLLVLVVAALLVLLSGVAPNPRQIGWLALQLLLSYLIWAVMEFCGKRCLNHPRIRGLSSPVRIGLVGLIILSIVSLAIGLMRLLR